MKTWTTKRGETYRSPIGALLDALAGCESAVLSEAREQGLPAQRRIRAQLAGDVFRGCAARWAS